MYENTYFYISWYSTFEIRLPLQTNIVELALESCVRFCLSLVVWSLFLSFAWTKKSAHCNMMVSWHAQKDSIFSKRKFITKDESRKSCENSSSLYFAGSAKGHYEVYDISVLR